MSAEPRRRAWTLVGTQPAEQGVLVTLDGRPLRVPSGPALVLPTAALAEAVAAEWAAAGGGVLGGSYHPDQMVLTGLAGALQQRTGPDRDGAIERLLAYLDGDALCYRASHPSGLVQCQSEEWQPWLDWLEARCGARLTVTEGVMPIGQSAQAVGQARALLGTLDDATLAGLGVLVPASGSLVLGLAVVLGALTAVDAHRLSLLDELDQAERWGQDGESAARHARLLSEFVAAERFVGLSRPVRAVRLLISGRVQGVGYRVWLQGEAVRAKVAGWTRNLHDGRVEAVLSGPAGAVDALVGRTRIGPRGAGVTGVVETAAAMTRAPGGFEIRPTAGGAVED